MRTLAVCLAVIAGLAWPGAAWADQPQDPPQQEGQEQAEKPPDYLVGNVFGIPVSGTLTLNYRLRWSGGERDMDLYEYLRTDVGDVDVDTVTAHVFLRVSEDFDGTKKSDAFYPFADITDTYRSRINERLYYGYVDVHRLGPIEDVRIGRQHHPELPQSLYLDGVEVSTFELRRLHQLFAGVYGGVPVHPFESVSSGDSVFGGWLQSALWRGARARLDYTRIRDSQLLGTVTNDLWGVNVWQNFGALAQINYRQTFLDNHARDLTARATFIEEDWKLQVQGSFYYLLSTQKVETTDLDFFSSVAHEYFPYWQTRLMVTKGIIDELTLDAGLDIRELKDREREGMFNHEFRRYFATATVTDWPLVGLGGSLTWELWNVPAGEGGDIATYGVEIRFRVIEGLVASAGSEYSLYKFDIHLDEERANVRTVYARVNYAVRKDLKIDLGLELEDGNEGDFRKIKVGVSQDF